jgi:PIN domain nuclease of toxin-antitoxin system
MRLLLDTHILLWSVAGSAQLKSTARSLIQSADTVYVSAASVWEIAIKSGLGKLDADPDEIVAAIGDSGFEELPIRAVHTAGVARLPNHHADPFDRLLIAQALHEPLHFVTADRVLTAYGDLVMLV